MISYSSAYKWDLRTIDLRPSCHYSVVDDTSVLYYSVHNTLEHFIEHLQHLNASFIRIISFRLMSVVTSFPSNLQICHLCLTNQILIAVFRHENSC